MIVWKAPAAVLAHVLLRAVPHVHVSSQLRVREEAFVADVTVRRVLLEVPSLMRGELRRLNEGTAAYVADEVTLRAVNATVHRESVAALEALVTDVAAVRSRVAVGYQVAVEQVLRAQTPRTERTLVGTCGQACISSVEVSRYSG